MIFVDSINVVEKSGMLKRCWKKIKRGMPDGSGIPLESLEHYSKEALI